MPIGETGSFLKHLQRPYRQAFVGDLIDEERIKNERAFCEVLYDLARGVSPKRVAKRYAAIIKNVRSMNDSTEDILVFWKKLNACPTFSEKRIHAFNKLRSILLFLDKHAPDRITDLKLELPGVTEQSLAGLVIAVRTARDRQFMQGFTLGLLEKLNIRSGGPSYGPCPHRMLPSLISGGILAFAVVSGAIAIGMFATKTIGVKEIPQPPTPILKQTVSPSIERTSRDGSTSTKEATNAVDKDVDIESSLVYKGTKYQDCSTDIVIRVQKSLVDSFREEPIFISVDCGAESRSVDPLSKQPIDASAVVSARRLEEEDTETEVAYIAKVNEYKGKSLIPRALWSFGTIYIDVKTRDRAIRRHRVSTAYNYLSPNPLMRKLICSRFTPGASFAADGNLVLDSKATTERLKSVLLTKDKSLATLVAGIIHRTQKPNGAISLSLGESKVQFENVSPKKDRVSMTCTQSKARPFSIIERQAISWVRIDRSRYTTEFWIDGQFKGLINKRTTRPDQFSIASSQRKVEVFQLFEVSKLPSSRK